MAEGGEEIEMDEMDNDYDDYDSEEKNMLFRSEKYNDLSITDDMNNMRKYDEYTAYNEKKDREKKEGKWYRERREKGKEVTKEYNEKKKALEESEKHASAEDLPPLEKKLLESAIKAFYARNGVRIPENLFMINFYRERDDKGRRILMVEGPNGEGYRLSFYKGTGDEQFLALSSLKNEYLVKKYLYIDKNAAGDNEEKPFIENVNDETSVKEMWVNIEKEIQEFEKKHPLHKVIVRRDYEGLMKAYTTVEEDLKLKIAKWNKQIEKEKTKLEQAEATEDIDRISGYIKDLKYERDEAQKELDSTKYEQRSQVNRMKETMRKVLNEDTKLTEKIKTLFREQGVTIASILTAFGMAIGFIVEAFTGAPSSTPPPPTPKGKGGAKEWLKKQLKYISKLLANLAGKAAAALPGIIGSIVSWLLTATKDVVNWFANNLWMLLVFVVGVLFVAAKEYINK